MRTGMQRPWVVGVALGALAAALLFVENAHAGAAAIRPAKLPASALLPAKEPATKTEIRVSSLEEARNFARIMASPTPAGPNSPEPSAAAAGLSSAKVDGKTGRVWLTIVNDQVSPQEHVYISFKTPTFTYTGLGTLTATLTATLVVRGMHVTPADPVAGATCSQRVALCLYLYQDGANYGGQPGQSVLVPGPGTYVVRADSCRLAPGRRYDATLVLEADNTGAFAGGIMLYDAQMTGINWSFQ